MLRHFVILKRAVVKKTLHAYCVILKCEVHDTEQYVGGYANHIRICRCDSGTRRVMWVCDHLIVPFERKSQRTCEVRENFLQLVVTAAKGCATTPTI